MGEETRDDVGELGEREAQQAEPADRHERKLETVERAPFEMPFGLRHHDAFTAGRESA